MLNDKDAIATLAVKDLQAARNFYQGTLGPAVRRTIDIEQGIGYELPP
jgi:catechol 2,3-dioxygenase-like lactoylglutathione lyase family enzyme